MNQKKIPKFTEAKEKFDAFDNKLNIQGNFQDIAPAGFVEVSNEIKKKRLLLKNFLENSLKIYN